MAWWVSLKAWRPSCCRQCWLLPSCSFSMRRLPAAPLGSWDWTATSTINASKQNTSEPWMIDFIKELTDCCKDWSQPSQWALELPGNLVMTSSSKDYKDDSDISSLSFWELLVIMKQILTNLCEETFFLPVGTAEPQSRLKVHSFTCLQASFGSETQGSLLKEGSFNKAEIKTTVWSRARDQTVQAEQIHGHHSETIWSTLDDVPLCNPSQSPTATTPYRKPFCILLVRVSFVYRGPYSAVWQSVERLCLKVIASSYWKR